jgi:hypothetical protein
VAYGPDADYEAWRDTAAHETEDAEAAESEPGALHDDADFDGIEGEGGDEYADE